MIEIKQTNKGFEIIRFLPFVNKGITIIKEKDYFSKWLSGEDHNGFK